MMLTASPSPRVNPTSSSPGDSTSLNAGFLSPSPRTKPRRPKSASPIVKPHSTHVYSDSWYPAASTPTFPSTATQTSQCSPTSRFIPQSHSLSVRSISTQTSPIHPSRPQMVDAQTQYSPTSINSSEPNSADPCQPSLHSSTVLDAPSATPASQISRLQIKESTEAILTRTKTKPGSARSDTAKATAPYSSNAGSNFYDPVADAAMPAATAGTITSTSIKSEQGKAEREPYTPSASTKRNHSVADARPQHILQDEADASTTAQKRKSGTPTPSKKMRPENEPVKIMPADYSLAQPHDLAVLISSMLMELIRYNDSLPLSSSQLTRFHSRAPPGISVHDYLARMTTHATLSPPVLLSMVYYIDKLCALYPAFTISSLTVHRFLITAATVASKGLSDSFWTNKVYARVGGVSVKELALLELEFLVRVQWRIVPRPEVLVDYYRSLVERSVGYLLEGQEDTAASERRKSEGMQDSGAIVKSEAQ